MRRREFAKLLACSLLAGCSGPSLPGASPTAAPSVLSPGSPESRFDVTVHTLKSPTGEVSDEGELVISTIRLVQFTLRSSARLSEATVTLPGKDGVVKMDLFATQEQGVVVYRDAVSTGAALPLTPAPWWKYGTTNVRPVSPSGVEGEYRLGGQYKATVRLSSKQAPLVPPAIAPVTAKDPSQGFPMEWAPVPGAAGYQVKVAQDRPLNLPEQPTNEELTSAPQWRSWNEDWLSLGSARALAKGVLLKEPRCQIPAGLFQGDITVAVTAFSPEARGEGEIACFGWAESSSQLDVSF